MTFVRSLAFVILFYLWSAVLAILILPFLLLPRSWTLGVFRLWSQGIFGLLRAICGVRVELRGREHMPTGRALVAAKHQCMLDVFAQFAWLDDSCFVMRKELMRIPFFGLYARKVGMVTLDREGGAAALRNLLRDARARLADPRPLVIFPEGTRGEPGQAGDYHPGVAGLYRDLQLACHPVATNSGVHWPAHGFIRRPGTIVFEYLEPIPPGLKRGDFMRELEARIEAASNALLPL
ncbi:MAG TPA: lysophospholipid acyltransferase family protein [Caulobacteraceae bacterium]|jgi:1-acyl-sn-glycerol-3-phosphate acyltransferase